MFFQRLCLPIVYKYFCIKNSNKQKELIIIADAHHEKVPPSMQMMDLTLQLLGYDITYYLEDYSKLPNLELLKSMIRFMELYSRARCIFLCDNFLPVASCNKCERTKVVQLWHGGGAFKKFGYSTTGDIPSYYKGNVFKNYDLITVSADMAVEHFAEAMCTDRVKIKPLGISRTDLYFDSKYIEKCRVKFYKMYPRCMNKRVVMWAPTFHGRLNNPFVVARDQIEKLGIMLGEEWELIIKLHPHMQDGHADSMSSLEMLPFVDFLITDYSSIVMDYLLFERPFAFYVPDYVKFMDERGVYTKLSAFPVKQTENIEDLYYEIVREWNENDRFKLHEAKLHYMRFCDGNATMRILNEIGLLKEV